MNLPSYSRTRRAAALVLALMPAMVVAAPPAVTVPAVISAASAPVQGYELIRVYPHARNAFSQGLIYLDGFLYESTGLNGASSVRKVDLASGAVLQQYDLDGRYFGEGLTNWGPNLIQLTWRNGVGFVYDRASFRLRQSFRFAGEGWGLTQDGRRLIMSDGTATLRFLDPLTLKETHALGVRDGGRPVTMLNELEYVHGEIYANVLGIDRIARISPETGQVLGWIDLSSLLSPAERTGTVGELNGIAYDGERDRLFVTGKRWPKLFEIRVK
ncbi:MAG: glutaminyl-peptide cyclotransferase [Chromatiales bacterium]|jgi:glutamine cyclotransferase|nr:glutaminyl-peptide cyclotransferase [Chromatiales bacterium]